jgi:SAM-dependent methyltransferase
VNTLRAKAQRLRGELNGTNRRRELARLEKKLKRSISRVERVAGDGSARERLQRQAAATDAWRRGPERDDRINAHLVRVVREAGLSAGQVLEIGGRAHPRGRVFGDAFTYRNLDLEGGDDTIVADITDCPQLDDGSFDVIVSVDVFEHIKEPWRAAQEISRLLAPGGLVYTSTLFSWRYHPCPVDYWRFSPEALEFIFSGVATVEKGFDATERRRDLRKKSKDDPLPFDEFGGWRENVRVYHVGVKPGAPEKTEREGGHGGG